MAYREVRCVFPEPDTRSPYPFPFLFKVWREAGEARRRQLRYAGGDDALDAREVPHGTLVPKTGGREELRDLGGRRRLAR